jgi:hypothetical protein
MNFDYIVFYIKKHVFIIPYKKPYNKKRYKIYLNLSCTNPMLNVYSWQLIHPAPASSWWP